MTVRYLAGGSYLDLTALYGVSVPGFYQSVWMVCEAIVDCVPITFDMRTQNLNQIANGFVRRQRKVAFRYVVGALDGMLVKIKRLSVKEFAKPVQMWCRKGYYGLNVQGMCDARRIFTFVAINCPASVHDSVAFSMSTLYQFLHLLPEPFVILADAAYKSIPLCLTPFDGRGRTEDEKNFSFFQSSLRINVECAFGALYQRWGILWRPLCASLRRNVLVIRACFALHNFTQLHNQPINVRLPRGHHSVHIDEAPYMHGEEDLQPVHVLAGDEAEEHQCVNTNMQTLHREITEELRQLGVRRPVPSLFTGV
eukprot:553907-Rhodomonas_salina.1